MFYACFCLLTFNTRGCCCVDQPICGIYATFWHAIGNLGRCYQTTKFKTGRTMILEKEHKNSLKSCFGLCESSMFIASGWKFPTLFQGQRDLLFFQTSGKAHGSIMFWLVWLRSFVMFPLDKSLMTSSCRLSIHDGWSHAREVSGTSERGRAQLDVGTSQIFVK